MLNMETLNEIQVTGQTIDLSGLTTEQRNYYETLAKDLSHHYLQNGKGRQVYTLSGPAGSGKSVITALLEHLLAGNDDFQYVNLGLDAFHHPNEVLEKNGLNEVKGRYDTYDTALLQERLQQLKAGKTVTFPVYSRQKHDPVPDSITVSKPDVLVLLEGQWLLRDTPDWAAIRSLCSYHLFVTGPAEALRENVIKRHIAGGRTPEDATHFYETSDLLNTEEILKTRVEPDEELVFYKDVK